MLGFVPVIRNVLGIGNIHPDVAEGRGQGEEKEAIPRYDTST